MGRNLDKRKSNPGNETSRAQWRSSGHRRNDRERVETIPERTLVGDQGSARKRQLQTSSGKKGRNPETGWWGEAIRDTDSDRSTTPTSDRTGTHAVMSGNSQHTATDSDPDGVHMTQ